MTKLKWPPREAGIDPAKIRKEGIPPQLSDREIKNWQNRIAKQVARVTAPVARPACRISLERALNGKHPHNLKLSERIKIVGRSGKTDCDRFIHETAMMVLVKAQADGDCTPSARLVIAIPASPRRQKLVEWFAAFSPIRINLRTQKPRIQRGTGGKAVGYDLLAADRNPFNCL